MRALASICCLTVAFFGPALLAAEGESAVCDILLTSGAVVAKPEMSASQARRLTVLLGKLTPEVRQTLYAKLKDESLLILAGQIRDGKLDPRQQAALAQNPGLDIAIQDLTDFSDTFPGIFQLSDPDTVITKVLATIEREEGRTTSADLLQSQAMAPRLKRTLDSAIINLIQQGTMEYGRGGAFGRSWFQFLRYKLSRFIHPTYQKVVDIIAYLQNYEKELTRLQLVDKLIIDVALSNARTLQLNDDEMQKLTFQVLNSPDEIEQIVKNVRDVLGEGFHYGPGVEIGSVDINVAARKAGMADLSEINEAFDEANVRALRILNEQLNEARKRQGLKVRQVSDFDVVELQLYVEAFVRRLSLYSEKYLNITSHKSNDEYQVYESYQDTEFYVDADGKLKSRSVTKYRWVTYTPSFEEILSGEYRTDHGTRGLEEVEQRAANMVERERSARQAIRGATKLVNQVLEGFSDAVMMGVKREELMKSMADQIQALSSMEHDVARYATLTGPEIKRQYSLDSEDNFRQRNKMMAKRLGNAKHLLEQLDELMRRNQLQLTPVFDLPDYTLWLAKLRSYRNWNYGRKIVAGAAAAGVTVAYFTVPEFALMVDQWVNHMSNTIEDLLPAGWQSDYRCEYVTSYWGELVRRCHMR